MFLLNLWFHVKHNFIFFKKLNNKIKTHCATAVSIDSFTGLSFVLSQIDLRVVLLFVAVIKTQLRIGSVDLVGVAFDNFCKACWSSFFDVENFINPNILLLVRGNYYY